MLYIKSQKYISASFIYRSEIPQDFAIAVYKVMHNQAEADEWELIDKYNVDNSILKWIKSILEDNGIENINQELEWWGRQISYPSN